jgi:putative ABC transport system substrate-binding protein
VQALHSPSENGTWPQGVLAQTINKKRPLVGWLSYGESDVAARYLGQLLKGMRELGLIEGRDFEMVYRSAEFHVERLPKAAEELVQLNPDIIVAPARARASRRSLGALRLARSCATI